MLDFISLFVANTWNLTAKMAPYLIIGFLISGLLFLLIRPEVVKRFLGKPGPGTVIKSCLIGIPVPLCSCSVIPVAASLKKTGASPGATAAFISSTPQTGVDSIFATYSLMGSVFTVVRIVVALISGLVIGFLIEIFCGRKNQEKETSITVTEESCCHEPVLQRPGFFQSLHYGFVKLPSDLAIALISGLVIAGLVTTLLPENLLEGSLSSGPVAFLIATLLGLPLYICATASIPMAYSLIAAGISPGAALVFLIVGPATNTTTVVTIWKIIGQRATWIYLLSLVLISWLAGWMLNVIINPQSISASMHSHEDFSIKLWEHWSGVFLMAIFAFSIIIKNGDKPREECCIG